MFGAYSHAESRSRNDRFVCVALQVWKRSMPNSDFVAIKSKASLAVSPQALFEVLTPGDIEIVRQVWHARWEHRR